MAELLIAFLRSKSATVLAPFKPGQSVARLAGASLAPLGTVIVEKLNAGLSLQRDLTGLRRGVRYGVVGWRSSEPRN